MEYEWDDYNDEMTVLAYACVMSMLVGVILLEEKAT